MYINYLLQGDPHASETGVESCIISPFQRDLTLLHLKELFPYHGSYHFRLKVNDGGGEESHVWLDLVQNEQNVLELARNFGGIYTIGSEKAVYLKVLPLSFDGDLTDEVSISEDDVYDWNSTPDRLDSNSTNLSAPSHQGRQEIESQSRNVSTLNARPLEVQNVSNLNHQHIYSKDTGGQNWKISVENKLNNALYSKTADDLKQAALYGFGNAKKLLAKIGQPSVSLPSHASLANLEDLHRLMKTEFNPSIRSHFELLSQLWIQLFPGEKPAASSPKWRNVGFRGDTIDSDLNGTGILCLHCMVQFTAQPAAKTLLASNRARSGPERYPFGRISRSLTLMLCEVFHLKSENFRNFRASFWVLFEDINFFCNIYCWAFIRLELIWARSSSKVDHIPRIIGRIRMEIESGLETGPNTFQSLLTD